MKLKKIALLSLLSVATFASSAANDNKFKPSEGKQIVGGEVAEENAWPWMAALVYTYEQLFTELTVDGEIIESDYFSNTPSGEVSGLLMSCGLGDAPCEAEGKVCLIERGEITFAEKALNCESGGGVGAIIYNNAEGTINGTLGDDFTGTIPVVAVTQEQGVALLDKVDTVATIEIAASPELAQSSFCGASFIGDRWVLTAAHCVDTASPEYLKVNVGEYDLSNGAEDARDVKNIYFHGDYNDVELTNDIALIELVEPVAGITPINLGDATITNQAAADNATVTVMGWGGRNGYEPGEGPTGNFPDILHQVDLTLFDNQECADIMAEAQEISEDVTPEEMGVAPGMICAGTYTGGRGSCQGDSGGPLIVDTNEGFQQVGVVSWGIGCAAQGYPGVYARVAEYLPWINAIRSGIAVQQRIDLGYLPTETNINVPLQITNNSGEATTVTFTSSHESYTIDATVCENIASGDSCEPTVTFGTSVAGQADATIAAAASNPEILSGQAKLTAYAVGAASNIEGEFDANDAIKWYSGGEAAWSSYSAGGVKSGTISDLERSVLLAQITGEGKLTFDWSVSSEENVDEPSEPFDALYLYVNGQLYDFISGDVSFTPVEIDLEEGTHHIAWVYEKDPYVSEGNDQGYVRNVKFASEDVDDTSQPVTQQPKNENSRSKGGFSLPLSLILLIPSLIAIRRRK